MHEPRQDREEERERGAEQPSPGGNAVYDEREQTRREDVRSDERAARGRGEPRRGSSPPSGEPPRARLPEDEDEVLRAEGEPLITEDEGRPEQGS